VVDVDVLTSFITATSEEGSKLSIGNAESTLSFELPNKRAPWIYLYFTYQ
jgi:hypothetical protein